MSAAFIAVGFKFSVDQALIWIRIQVFSALDAEFHALLCEVWRLIPDDQTLRDRYRLEITKEKTCRTV